MDRVSEDSQPTERFPYWGRNMWTAFAACAVANVGFSASYPYLPLILREMGFQENLESWVGLVVGVFFLTSLLITPLWGVVADHYGKKSMTLRAGFGMGLGFFLMAFAPNLWWFLPPLILAGACNGFVPALGALLATNTPTRHMGTVLSVSQIGAQGGNLAGPALGAALVAFLPVYRQLYWVSSAGLIGAGLLALFLVREVKAAVVEPFRLHLLRDAVQVLRVPGMPLLFYLNYVFSATVYGTTPVVSVLTLQMLEDGGTEWGIGVETWVGIVAMAIYASSICSLPLWGRLLDRYDQSWMLAAIMVLAFLSSLTLPLVQTAWQLAAARLLFGLCSAGMQPAVMRMIRLKAPRGMHGRAIYFGTVFHMLGMCLAALIAGVVGPLFGLRAYLALNCIFLLMGLVLWLRSMRGQSSLQPGAST